MQESCKKGNIIKNGTSNHGNPYRMMGYYRRINMNLNSEIWAAAPETEPERQYYFIEVCKKQVAEREEKLAVP